MKRCRRCGAVKCLDAFHRHRSNPDGRQWYCKACHAAANRRSRAKRRERTGAGYDIESRREALRLLNATEERRAAKREWRERNRQKWRAHKAVERAIGRGDMERPAACERCGRDVLAIVAHHEDYGAPLEVEWLCASCHQLEHLGIAA